MTAQGRREVSLLALLIVAGMIVAAIADRPRPLDAPARHGEFGPLVLDVNASPWPSLVMIEGIGPATARSIVEERERGGAFINADDLAARVRGVGPATAEAVWNAAAPAD